MLEILRDLLEIMPDPVGLNKVRLSSPRLPCLDVADLYYARYVDSRWDGVDSFWI